MPSIALGIAVGVAIAGIAFAWRALKPRWIFALCVALAAILGALRFNLAQPHFDQTSLATRSANDQQKSVIVDGVVIAEPDARDAYTNLRVGSDKLIIADQTGRLRAGFRRFQVSVRRGTILTCNPTSDPRSG